MNTVFIMIAAYFMFGEALNKIKFLSIACLVSSVVLVSLFTPDSIQEAIQSVPSGSATSALDHAINDVSSDFHYLQTVMIVSGLIASVCFGSQLLVFKVIMRHTKDTFAIGFGFLFWCGLLGFLTLGFEVVRVPHEI